MKVLIIIILFIIVISCTNNDYDKLINNYGGYEELKKECYILTTGSFAHATITPPSISSNFPSLISKLKPKIVMLYQEEPKIVYIDIEGGFSGHGLLVVCDINDKNYEIKKEPDFLLKELYPGVYEYKCFD